MSKSLVIVESPAKAKTINKFLGENYVVTSSMGHIVDLPKSKLGVDVEDNFRPEYVVMADRKKNLALLKKEAKDKHAIYLAADPDREGEAICWHIKNILSETEKEGHEAKKFYRVKFDEITKEAVINAFKHPRDIDMHLVNAQQARRILDRIVGYTLSPLLWKKVSRGLSAGRVQSVAVKLIVEREEEIKKFKPEEYWDITAELKRKGDSPKEKFAAKLDRYKDKKVEIKRKEEAEHICSALREEAFIVGDIKESKKKKNPYPPFTTSKLQQEAFNKLRFSGAKTMHVAQGLYEGVEIGKEGSVGLITYMRTDSVRVSKEAQSDARRYILEKFGKKYYPETPNVYKSRKSAQEAHEAIRPTLPLREPDSLKDYLTADQLKLYTLIWNRFIASQMAAAVYSQTSVDILAGDYVFKAASTKIIFDGYTVVYEAEQEKETEEGVSRSLAELSIDEPLDLLDIIPAQHFTKPPPRYSDASLVKALEELGIGRPSTYAPIIQTITARDYVRRESGYFHPTELGIMITTLLMRHFPKILDVEFTARMEDELDGIEEGEADWITVLKSFYSPFIHSVEQAKLEMKDVKKEVVSTNEVCSICGKPMVIKWGRRGKFLSCSDYPTCKNAKSITSGVKCPTGCGGELIQRRSKRGSFYGCSNYPNCKFISKKLPEGHEDKG
ncbi:MAG: type I DNA topoisomerase [Candidatus Omnitrophica bacterium]|nr:type I DNA topoisomerase [Candidatus Omnitrophota bacterium]MCM8790943.1 type I DNA topoisomerase [Candidatus Omnitrophota bacterium]